MIEKIAIILLANLVFFSKTLTYRYSSDDIPVYMNPPNFRNKWEKRWYWLIGRMRINPQEDHALTTLIHAIVCVFIYIGFGANDISFIASLLFAFNPTNNQGSVWISGRSYALAALGMTGALAFPMLALGFIFIAVSTNPGFLAPIVLFGSKANPWILAVFIGLAWGWHGRNFYSNVKHKMNKEMFTEDKAFKIEKFVLAIKTYGFYTTLSIIPFKNAFYHSFLQACAGSGKNKAYSVKDRFFWIGLAFFAAVAWYWLAVPWNMVSFGLLWWIVCLAPFSNFFRMSQEIAERYVFLPSVGLMFVLASIIYTNPILVAVFLTMYVVRKWFLIDQYTDDYYLLEHSCVLEPSAWFTWHQRGLIRWDKKSYQEAIIIWTMARMLSPNEFKINFNLATALYVSGHKENKKEAVYFLKVAEDNIPAGQEEECKRLIEAFRKKGETAILT